MCTQNNQKWYLITFGAIIFQIWVIFAHFTSCIDEQFVFFRLLSMEQYSTGSSEGKTKKCIHLKRILSSYSWGMDKKRTKFSVLGGFLVKIEISLRDCWLEWPEINFKLTKKVFQVIRSMNEHSKNLKYSDGQKLLR